MPPVVALVVYSVLVVLASVGGGLLPLAGGWSHRRMQLVLSGVSGFMLGVALLHLLPHAFEQGAAAGAVGGVGVAVLAGLLGMFLIERFFAFHEHEAPAVAGDHGAHAHSHGAGGHDHTCGPGLHWAGAAVGMTLHSVIGGVALAAAVLSETRGDHAAALPGLAAALVVLLHKPLDAVTVLALVKRSGMSRSRGHLINGLFALAVPVGAALGAVGLGVWMGEHPAWLAYALAFSAGTFLCIALSDVLPELHFHDHDRVPLTLALLVGVALAVGVEKLEHAGHDHGHDGGHNAVEPRGEDHDHGHAGHAH